MNFMREQESAIRDDLQGSRSIKRCRCLPAPVAFRVFLCHNETMPATTAKTKPRTHAVRKRHRKPDMKAWAAFAFSRLKAQYGDRIVPDSATLLEEMRADRI
jgi:hypothetical protein